MPRAVGTCENVGREFRHSHRSPVLPNVNSESSSLEARGSRIIFADDLRKRCTSTTAPAFDSTLLAGSFLSSASESRSRSVCLVLTSHCCKCYFGMVVAGQIFLGPIQQRNIFIAPYHTPAVASRSSFISPLTIFTGRRPNLVA
jgi:hypothetical protein